MLVSHNFTILKRKVDTKMNRIRGFEVVKENKRKTTGEIKLPQRGTSKAMAYDFYANDEYVIKPNEVAKIWTDVKAYMGDNEGLIICIRSSMGGKFVLNNQIGVIDADYYSNENNDGNIGVFLRNITENTQCIHKGDRIAQGFFIPYLLADNDNGNDKIRQGGFGSTGNK